MFKRNLSLVFIMILVIGAAFLSFNCSEAGLTDAGGSNDTTIVENSTTTTMPTTTTSINKTKYIAFNKLTEPYSEQPCIVNLIFGLKDYDSNILPGIYDPARYKLLEDGSPLAYAESFYRFKERALFEVALKTVIMMDISYSVGATNIVKLKDAVKSIINNKSANQEISIYTFSGTVTLVKDFSLNKTELIAAVDGINLGSSSTNLYGAIYDGLDRFSSTIVNKLVTNTFMIVLTDGVDTSGIRTLDQALTKRGDKSVITVGIGSDVDPDILKNLGNFGSFMATNFDTLQTYINSMRNFITEAYNNLCWLTYYSPKRAGTHTIELSIIDNTNTGASSKISGIFSATSPQFYDVAPGIYVNDSLINTSGDLEIIFADTDTTKTIRINSYFGAKEPVYTLQISDPASYTIAEVTTDTKKSYSLTRVNGGNVTLTINDTANGYTKNIAIKGKSIPTVIFNSNGGSAVASQTSLVEFYAAQPSTPTKTGYTFGGWYKESSFVTLWNFTTDIVSEAITLYAKWTINSYTVSFNTNGGSSVGSQTINYGGKVSQPSAPTKTGYTFGGWYKESTFTNLWNFGTDTVTANKTLYAKWAINSYTVTFNSNEGSNVNSQTINYGGKVSQPAIPTKTGYTFGGWYKESTFTNLWNFGTDTVTSNKTLYAKWGFVVSFNSNGGSSVSSQVIINNGLVTEPPAPIKTGYAFGGWYKELALTNVWNFGTDTVTANITLYAKWTINSYSITFNSNGGSSVSSQTINYGGLVTQPTAPIKTGYTFSGWYKESTFTNLWNFTTDTVTAIVTLYVKWTINSYTVTFSSNGGSSVSSQTINYGGLVTQPTTPTKTGYTFAGWYKELELTNVWNFGTDTVTANITLYAKWTINSYSVSFYTGGGSEVSSQNINYDGLVIQPAAPTRAGYTFAGWYKELALTTIWDFSSYTVIANVTIYAKWMANNYTITFDKNDAEAIGTMTDQTIVCDSSADLIENSFNKTGWTFVGWSTTSDGSITYANGAKYIMGAGNVTLFAKWTINSYTITFNSNGGSSVSSQIIINNGLVTEPSVPIKTGHTFGGWYKESTFTNLWNFGTDAVTTNSTLYSMWTANNYTITFNKNDASAAGTMSNQTIACDSSANLIENAFYKTGWTFVGWATSAGVAAVYVNGASYTMGFSNITLYAKWIHSSLVPLEKREVVSITGGTYTQTDGTNSFKHTISSFFMAKYQVTYELWYTVYQWAIVNGYTFANAGREGNDGTIGAAPTTAKYEPVTTVNWRDSIVWCNAYSEMSGLTPCYTYASATIKDSQDANATACDSAVCDWSANGYRLPTEGEWQYSASYKDGTSWTPYNYASGATANYTNATECQRVSWYSANSGSKTRDVGTKDANALGLYDMSGNVWEWCWDWKSNYPTVNKIDYKGPDSGSGHIRRCGSWYHNSFTLEIGARYYSAPDLGDCYLGFRVARGQ